VGRVARWAPEAAVVVLAAALRLVALARVPVDPYYDAAVRSMGTSWPALLSGAYEPGRRVAIDKPPIDLWLQVLSTRVLGFGPLALHLPEAVAGLALVVASMALLRALLGRGAGLAAGLALAVLPAAVVTARSDTMDTVMAALAVTAAALVARAARRDGAGVAPLAAAGALLGLAFEVKLAEALLPAAAVALLWVLTGPRGRRVRGAAAGATAFMVLAVAWLIVVSVLTLHPRPWALGSTSGSPWQAALVYNGVDRIVPGRSSHTSAAAGVASLPMPRGHLAAAQRRAVARHQHDQAVALARRPGGPSPVRLLSSRAHLRTWIGIEAVAALAALAAALALGALRSGRADRVARGGVAALAVWLAGGLVLCSVMPDLRPRYLEGVGPAVAGVLGAGVVLAARGRALVAGGVLAAVLAVPLMVSVGAVAHHTQDSGRPGAIAEARVAPLADYVRARDGAAADELAVSAPAKAGQLIARDGRPVLILSDGAGRQLVTPAQLARAVAAGRVRFALLGDGCSAGSGNARTGCLPVMRWARRHGTDVSRAAGQPHRGALYDLRPSGAGRAASGRTPTSATSSRTPRYSASSAGRRASHGPGGRAARARRSSRRRSGATRSPPPPAPARSGRPARRSGRCAATATSTGARCRGSRAAARRRARPGRRSRGSRARAAAAPAGTAAEPGSRRPRVRRPRAARPARTPAARSSRRRWTHR
jgi:4-amino-4-deoxy-L-arabinose transferase-like glycosyltransferase